MPAVSVRRLASHLAAGVFAVLVAAPYALGAQAAPAPTVRADPRPDSAAGVLDADDPWVLPDGRGRGGLARRLGGGFAIAVSQPLGDFRRGGKVGVGVAAYASLAADPTGVLGLRLEGGGQNYGTSSLRQSLGGSAFSGPGRFRQVTSNDVFWFGVGPQVAIPLGPVRPYGFATVGAANYTTTTTVQYAGYGNYGGYPGPYGGYGSYGASGSYYDDREYRSTDLSSWTFARAFGGGVRVRAARSRARAVYVDAGARWQRGNDVRYLAPGALPFGVDARDLALRGRADFVTYHLGVSVAGR